MHPLGWLYIHITSSQDSCALTNQLVTDSNQYCRSEAGRLSILGDGTPSKFP